MEREQAEQKIKEKKYKRAMRCYRLRPLKNLFIWFTGILTSFVILIGGIFIGVKVVPISTYTGGKTDEIVSPEIAEKSIVDAIMGFKEYKIGDIPAIQNALKQMSEGSGMDRFVSIDFDKLNDVNFVYQSGETDLLAEIQKCIKVTATVESVGGTEALGDLGTLGVFNNWDEVPPELQPDIDSNGNITMVDGVLASQPQLYYYRVPVAPMGGGTGFAEVVPEEPSTPSTEYNYLRAFDDNGVRLAPTGEIFYLPNLSKIPITDVTKVIGERLGTVVITDLLKVFGSVPDDSMVGKLLKGQTISSIGTISPDDIKLYDILGGAETDDIYKILGSATADAEGNKTPYNELNLGQLTGSLDIGKIKLYDILGGTEADDIYKILGSATADAEGNKTPFDQISISQLTGSLDIGKVKLYDILGGTADDIIYKILSSATAGTGEPTPFDQISISQLTGSLDIGKVKLYDILGGNAEDQIYKILSSATNTPYNEITINTLTGSSLEFTNIELDSVMTLDKGSSIYKILVDATGKDNSEGNKIKISDLTTLSVDNLKLTSVMTLDDASTLTKILLDATGETDKNNITIGILSNPVTFNINNVKLTSVLSLDPGSALLKILKDATGKDNTAGNEILISDLSSFDFESVKLSSVMNLGADSALLKILKDATGKDNTAGNEILISDLSTFDFESVKLSSVMNLGADSALLKILKDATGKDNSDSQPILVKDLTTFSLDNVKLDSVLNLSEGSSLLKLLKDATGKNNTTNKILVKDLSTLNIENVKLSSVMSNSGGNTILQALLDDNVTIGNMGATITNMPITSVFSNTDCFTTIPTSGKIYKKATDSTGKVFYVESSLATGYFSSHSLNAEVGDKNYYVSSSASMWIFINYNKIDTGSGTNNSEGYVNGYEEKGLTINTMGSEMGNISKSIMSASIRELIDAGIMDAGSFHETLYPMSLKKVIEMANTALSAPKFP